MAATRKLQAEIGRCLKKVGEGVEKFEETWQKVHNASNTNQKEKYEEDLKKEIKKLQRLRDQIKTWLASPDIKDKSTLMDKRKLIGQQMERFKVVERETKTKAYSKEGLTSGQKLDPVEKERYETSTWIKQCIDDINVQIDGFEAEIESLGITKKRKNRNDDKIEEINVHLEKHRDHVQKLETLLRMLDNDTVDINQIKDIKDDIEYYIENCMDPDFAENECMYDDIDGLEEMLLDVSNVGNQENNTNSVDASETMSTTSGSSPVPSMNNHSNDHGLDEKRRHKSSSEDNKVDLSRSSSNNKSSSTTINNNNNSTTTPTSSSSSSSTPSSTSSSTTTTTSSSSSSSSSTTSAAVSSSSAAASSSTTTTTTSSSSTPTSKTTSTPIKTSSTSLGPTPANFAAAAARAAQQNGHIVAPNSNMSDLGRSSSPTLLQHSGASSSSLVHSSYAPKGSAAREDVNSSVQVGNESISSLKSLTESAVNKLNEHQLQEQQQQLQQQQQQLQQQQQPPNVVTSVNVSQTSHHNNKGEAYIPPLLGVAPLGRVPLTKDTQIQYQMLEAAYMHMPHPSDSERLRPYLPRNPCPTPGHYPQVPPAGSDTIDYFQRLSTETLFFIFYYMEGTKAQYLSAKALKKQSWRFHTKYMMWFQRHEEPKIINDEYEQGTYIYFDFERWGQRKKEGFTFEYRFLEGRDLN